VSASASVNSSGVLVVSWKEAGLGDNMLINYTAGADATATHMYVNGGGKHHSVNNKEAALGPVSASGAFNSGKNSNITASLTLNPLGPRSFSCPSGQTLELAQVSYTNVSIRDDTNSITQPIPGTFSQCLFTLSPLSQHIAAHQQHQQPTVAKWVSTIVLERT
jgi:hypothetical protein